MKMCLPHWEQLRKAIDDRGLGHLVAPTGDALKDSIEKELSGEAHTAVTYDPLHAATMGIYSNALRAGGLYLMTSELCPLCEMEAHTEGKAGPDWIDPCCDAILAHCREQGWVTAVQ